MKVAVVGPTYPHRGGIAQYTSLLAFHLSQQCDMRLYGFRQQYPNWLFPGRSQIDPSPKPLFDIEARRWLIPWWPLTWRRVVKDWQTWKPDRVVIQWWVPYMAPMTAWLASWARRHDIPTVFICHNVLPHERSRLDTMLVRLALSRADHLITHGKSDLARARRLLPDAHIEAIALPTYAKLQSEEWTRERARAMLHLDDRVLLFFGFVRPYKGLLDLLDALPHVLADVDVMLLVVGEIWGKPDVYIERAKQLGLESRVQFVDRYVSNDEAAMYFAASDLTVLPYREATGSAVLQLAFGLGVPVVATRTGGMGESVEDGVTGFLVDPGDVDGLSRAIVRFFREKRTAEFRQNIKKQALRFGWNRIVTAIENIGDKST